VDVSLLQAYSLSLQKASLILLFSRSICKK
jgi:hypothetical protein